MRIRFAGKTYEVKDVRTLPGGATQYAIEDELNHIDWVSAEVVLDDATYKTKTSGEPYPKSKAKFSK